MSSCCNTNQNTLSPLSKPPHPSIFTSWDSSLAPILSALLHSSCCWLPALINLVTVGSASVAIRSVAKGLLVKILDASPLPASSWCYLSCLLSLGAGASQPRTVAVTSAGSARMTIALAMGVQALLRTRNAASKVQMQCVIRNGLGFRPIPSRAFACSVLLASKKHPSSAFNLLNRDGSILDANFWTSHSAWRRAGVNTLRCLLGCTTGDFSTMWYLQGYYPVLDFGTIMALSMAAGLATSLTLETILLHVGPDKLSWQGAFNTAMGMSFVSMLAMEGTQNIVDFYLMGGVVAFGEARFWLAAGLSMCAGFLVPLPYNYVRLRRHGKACH